MPACHRGRTAVHPWRSSLAAVPAPAAGVAAARGLAANPAFGIDLLRPLLASTDRVTLLALADRPDLTAADAADLAARGDPALRQALARNPPAAVHAWPHLVDDPDSETRMFLAGWGRYRRHRPGAGPVPPEPPLPEPALLALAADPDERVRWNLVYLRPHPPARVWARLAADPSPEVRRRVAAAWRSPPAETLRALLTDPDSGVRADAARRHAPPPDLVPGLLADPATGAAVAASARLDHATATALLADPDDVVREALAGNSHLPAPLVERLARDASEAVREAVMLRPDLPDALRVEVAATVEPRDYHLASWLLPGDAPLAERLANVESPLALCRRAVACSPDLPSDAVARLAADRDHGVRLLLAEHHPDVPGDLLTELVGDTGHVRFVLAAHPKMPAATLVALAESDDLGLVRAAAGAPGLPGEVAVRLTTHPDFETRRLAAANPALPAADILRLVDGPDPDLATAAASNPRLPPAAAQRILAAAAGEPLAGERS